MLNKGVPLEQNTLQFSLIRVAIYIYKTMGFLDFKRTRSYCCTIRIARPLFIEKSQFWHGGIWYIFSIIQYLFYVTYFRYKQVDVSFVTGIMKPLHFCFVSGLPRVFDHLLDSQTRTRRRGGGFPCLAISELMGKLQFWSMEVIFPQRRSVFPLASPLKRKSLDL